MRRNLLSLVLLLCACAFVAYGCDDGGGKKDADADVPIDRPPDTPIDTPPDVPQDRDVAPEPDVTPDVPAETEITPDLPPDSTGCTPLMGGTCSVIDNCNCTSGQACGFMRNPADNCDLDETCAASSGTLPTGSECDPAATSEPCAPGNTCLTLTSTGDSNCYKWCDGDEDCDAGHSCNIQIGFQMGGECPDLTLTYKACDLGCPTDAACDPFTGSPCSGTYNACLYDFTCAITFCAASGAHAIGEDCTDTGACVIGAECLTTDGGVTNFCLAFCDSSHACTTGTCTAFTPPYAANPSLGACISG